MNILARVIFPLLVAAGGAFYLAMVAVPPSDPPAGMHLQQFAKTPVVDRGRVKPLDTVARNSLMIISHRQSATDKDGKSIEPIKWMLDVMTTHLPGKGSALKHRYVYIENEQILGFLGLKPRPGRPFDIADLQSQRSRLRDMAQAVMHRAGGDRQAVDEALVELYAQVEFFFQLVAWENDPNLSPDTFRMVLALQPPKGTAESYDVFRIENDQVLNFLELDEKPGLRYSIKDLAPKISLLDQQMERIAAKSAKKNQELFDAKTMKLAEQLRIYLELSELKMPLAIPVVSSPDTWRSFPEALERASKPEEGQDIPWFMITDESLAFLHEKGVPEEVVDKLAPLKDRMFPGPTHFSENLAGVLGQPELDRYKLIVQLSANDSATESFGRVLRAYALDRPEDFNRELSAYQGAVEELMPKEARKARFEAFFNHFAPFYHCAVLYAVVFLLACAGLIGLAVGSPLPFNRAAFGLTGVILIVHSFALVARMYIQERPPVTNLYSSAVWIGWLAVILGMVIEGVFGRGIGNIVGSAIGATTLVIAHNLASAGDTLEMMEAVLDTNFWLATHVTVVTFGYAATFVAGVAAIVFVCLRLCTRLLEDDGVRKIFGWIIYGIICFATLLSFTGTMLGGIWADQSWGRFWGWDPKENGALLIVIWNALILHARWSGLVHQRGVAVMAIFGNIVTAWSWFGVNMLGIGLHSYGFMEGAVTWLLTWVGFNGVMMGLAFVPTKWIWSDTRDKRKRRRTEPEHESSDTSIRELVGGSR